jgi:signal transduction histidine kinase
MGAGILRRPDVAVLSVVCALLRESLGPSAWEQDALIRLLTVSTAFCVSGLLVRELMRNRELVLERSKELTQRHKLEAQLLQAQKFQAVGRLAGNMAHEFNNLLTIITGYGHLLQVDLAADHPARSCADDIVAAAERASRLTSQLLVLSQRREMRATAVDVNETITALVPAIRAAAGERVRVETGLEPDLPLVYADPTQIEQVIHNSGRECEERNAFRREADCPDFSKRDRSCHP